jgi:catalase
MGHGIEIPPARGVGNGSRGAFVQWLSTATADEFRQFLIALGSSGPGVAASTPADTYLATHPIAKSFLESQQPPPVSYATLSYFGVNSFKFTNAQGQVSFGRYRIEPRLATSFYLRRKLRKPPPAT